MAFYTTPPLTEKSGTSNIGATAEFNLYYAPSGHILVADGFGNVTDSGVPISRVGVTQLPAVVDIGVF